MPGQDRVLKRIRVHGCSRLRQAFERLVWHVVDLDSLQARILDASR